MHCSWMSQLAACARLQVPLLWLCHGMALLGGQ